MRKNKILQIFLFVSSLILINSCGLTPLHKTNHGDKNNSYEEKLAAISVSGKRKRINQKLQNNLEEILNPNKIAKDKLYLLDINLTQSISTTFINPTGSAGREKVTLDASYSLKNIDNNEIIATGSATSSDDYDIEDKRFANYIVREEIELNLTKLIAQNIRDSLINDLFSNTETSASEEVFTD